MWRTAGTARYNLSGFPWNGQQKTGKDKGPHLIKKKNHRIKNCWHTGTRSIDQSSASPTMGGMKNFGTKKNLSNLQSDLSICIWRKWIWETNHILKVTNCSQQGQNKCLSSPALGSKLLWTCKSCFIRRGSQGLILWVITELKWHIL